MSSATHVRVPYLFRLAKQCHTQNFYLRCFKSDFDAVKGKVGLLDEKIETGYGVHSPLTVFATPPLCVCSPVCLSQEFKVRF